MKTKMAFFNIISNIFGKILIIILGIIVPKLIIENFGSETNGLLASISGIFVYLNLLEMGIGGASRQALYRPITENNQDKINSIMSATNVFYQKTGVYFLACISILAFLFPIILKSEIEYFEIVLIILVTAISSLINYFFSAKYVVLINADNKGHVINIINSFTSVIISLTKIVLILNSFDILTVQISFSLINVFKAFILKLYISKNYKNLNLNVKPDMESISQKSYVIVHQMADIVFKNTDVLILSVFCGLKVASVYAIYNTIYSHIAFIPEAFYNGIVSSFGQLYTENKERFKKIYNFYEVYYVGLIFVFFVVTYVLLIPFMQLYTNDMNDFNYIDQKLSLMFFAVYILSYLRSPSLTLINITGQFKSTQMSAVIEMIINLIISLILVNKIGIYGVLVGTIVALIYRSIDLNLYTSKNILFRSSITLILRWIINSLIGLVIIFYMKSFNIQIDNYLDFLIIGTILTIVVGLVYLILITMIEKNARLELIRYTNILLNKIKN